MAMVAGGRGVFITVLDAEESQNLKFGVKEASSPGGSGSVLGKSISDRSPGRTCGLGERRDS
jgi:hypothetical protein